MIFFCFVIVSEVFIYVLFCILNKLNIFGMCNDDLLAKVDLNFSSLSLGFVFVPHFQDYLVVNASMCSAMPSQLQAPWLN
jgi:hypothetical protein